VKSQPIERFNDPAVTCPVCGSATWAVWHNGRDAAMCCNENCDEAIVAVVDEEGQWQGVSQS
jgi:hypothetical protein